MQIHSIIIALMLMAASFDAKAEEKVVPIKYGNMDTWVLRSIHESAVIGGNTKTLYEVGPSKATTPTTTSEARPGAQAMSWRR